MYVPVFQRVLEEKKKPNLGLIKLLQDLRQEETASMLENRDLEAACLSLRFFGSCMTKEHHLNEVKNGNVPRAKSIL